MKAAKMIRIAVVLHFIAKPSVTPLFGGRTTAL